MYSPNDLAREIISNIEAVLSAGQIVKPDWVTIAVLNSHQEPETEDKDFWILCAKRAVREEVRKQVGRYEIRPTVDVDKQMVLEGFERLQKVYVLNRDGEQVGVPIVLATATELLAKADELHFMGVGCFQHEDELRRYVAERKQVG